MAKKRKQKPQKKNIKKLNPNRFQKQDEQGLFSFDPIRRDILKWGLIAGAIGGLFIIQPPLWSKILGTFIVVVIANYHTRKATRRIAPWQAIILTYIGVFIAMVSMAAIGSVILSFLQTGGGNG